MTRAEHEEKFRRSATRVAQARLQLAREPGLPGLPHRRAQASVRAVGLGHAQPVRLEGPVLPADGRDLPDLRGAPRRDRVGALRAGERPALRALRHPLRLRAVGDHRDDLERQGDRAEPRLDAALALTLACALEVEERAARRAGARARARRPRRASAAPRRPARLVRPRRRARRTASSRARCSTRPSVVDADGRDALGGRAVSASPVRARRSICAAGESSTTRTSGAQLAQTNRAPTPSTWRAARSRATGRLAGVVRAVSDTPARPLGAARARGASRTAAPTGGSSRRPSSRSRVRSVRDSRAPRARALARAAAAPRRRSR